MGSKDQLFLLKLESYEDQKERANLIEGYLRSFSDNESDNIQIVPDFPAESEWLNIADSLSFKSNLRGKICVLDFFTYCCINCMHILPDLHALEEEHSVEDGVVVVGVHSAKFENEKVSSNILNAVLRYGISHPVVNDGNALLWNTMEIACWPTLVVVGPKGQHLLSLVGEGHRKTLFEFVGAALKWFKSLGEISNHAIDISLTKDTLPQTTLSFPGKLSLNKSGKKFAISDTGHHRILLVDTSGMVENTVGGGTSAELGFIDGNFEEARFNSPQGVAWNGDTKLFVADTENHAIRMIDLKAQKVTTVAGTGEQGNEKIGGKIGRDQPISSPWDVVVGPAPGALNIMEDESVLYIAMAGTHQLWGLCLVDTRWLKGSEQKAWTCLRFSGSGAEENRNNSYPHKTGFAQPSGLSVAREKPFECIFIADSESSSVRSVAITSGGSKALVGADRDPMNLFAFGDVDGNGVEAKLQHPLAVSWNVHTQQLFVADSYNHKIKVVDPAKKSCKVIMGTDKPGSSDGGTEDAQFNEPGGLDTSPDGKTLYVADTNNHAVRVVDLETNTVSTLPIIGHLVDASEQPSDKTDSGESEPGYRRLAPLSASVINCEPVVVTRTSVDLQFSFSLPKNCKLTAGVQSKWQSALFDGNKEKDEGRIIHRGVLLSQDVPVLVGIQIPTTIKMTLQMEAKIYFCEPDGACYMQGVVFKCPVTYKVGGSRGQPGRPVRLHYDCKKP